MRLVLMQFMSLDGVTQGPGAPDEDTTGGFARGGWFVPYVDEAFLAQAGEWTARADAFLFGRRTYEAFAGHWPSVRDPGDAIAAALNGLPKYVASNHLAEAGWGPGEVLSGDVAARVAQLKALPGRELQVHGSTTLGRFLLACGLVDELRLAVAPVVVGEGRRLFPAEGEAMALQPVASATMPSGIALLSYAPAGAPWYGSYGA